MPCRICRLMPKDRDHEGLCCDCFEYLYGQLSEAEMKAWVKALFAKWKKAAA